MSEYDTKKLILFDIDDVLFNTEYFISSNLSDFKLYEDVLNTLSELSKDFEIGILSQGDLTLQIKKLVETGIESKFNKNHIHIVEKKDESLLNTLKHYEKSDNIFYIDDRLKGMYFAKKAIPKLKTIWLKQGRHHEFEEKIEGFEPDFTIFKVSDVLKIIKN